MDGFEQPQSKTKIYVIAGSVATVVLGVAIMAVVVYRARTLDQDTAPSGEVTSGDAQPSTGQPSSETGLGSRPADGVTAPAASDDKTDAPASSTTAASEAVKKAESINSAPDYTGAKDSDKDNVPDGVEAAYRTDPTKSDTDGDGYSDYDEIYVYGTDPVDGTKDPKTSEGLFKPNK
jgi:hypothetical protein